MPITVKYSPPAGEIFDLAYQGGIGDYNRWLTEQAMRQRALDQQAISDQNRLAAQLYSQDQNRLFDMQQAQMRFDYGNQQQMRNIAADMAIAQQRNAWGLQENQQQQQFALERQQQAAGLEWQAQSAEQVEKQTDAVWNQVFANRQQIAPEDQATFREFAANLQAIKKSRGQIRPEQYAQAMGEFNERLMKSGIQQRMTTPKTFAEQVEEQSISKPVLAPDGTFMGWNVWTPQVRNGQSVPTSRFVPFKPEKPAKEETPSFSVPTAAGFKLWLEKNRKNFDVVNPVDGTKRPASTVELGKRYVEEVEAASKIEQQTLDDYIKELEQEEKKHRGEELLAQARAAGIKLPSDPMFGGQGYPWMKQPQQSPPVTPVNAAQPAAAQPAPQVTDDEYAATGALADIGGYPGVDVGEATFFADQSGMYAPARQTTPPPPPVPQPPPAPPAAPPVPTLQAALPANAPIVERLAADPEVVARVTPEKLAEAAKLGSIDPVADVMVIAGIEVARERDEAAAAKRPKQKSANAKVSDIPAADQRLLDQLPRPRTKADYDKLHKGEEFIAPDGSLRRK